MKGMNKASGSRCDPGAFRRRSKLGVAPGQVNLILSFRGVAATLQTQKCSVGAALSEHQVKAGPDIKGFSAKPEIQGRVRTETPEGEGEQHHWATRSDLAESNDMPSEGDGATEHEEITKSKRGITKSEQSESCQSEENADPLPNSNSLAQDQPGAEGNKCGRDPGDHS